MTSTSSAATCVYAHGQIAEVVPGSVGLVGVLRAERLASGISTRRCPVTLEPVGAAVEASASATSKSAVSRRFVTATAELLDRRLDEQRWLIVYLDGFAMGDHLMVGALGVTADGTKVAPSAWSRAPPRTRPCAPAWSPTWPSSA